MLNKKVDMNLYYINFITATSVFAYAVLYSSLSLYFTEIAGFSKQQSNCLVGIFISFNFLLHLFAGYIGGKLISNINLLGISLVSLFVGSLSLVCLKMEYMYVGLSLFLIGCGFGVTCLNCLLTDQFEEKSSEQREKAFFINYSILNVGFFLGFLVSGYFYSINNYRMLFLVNLIFSAISLCFFFLLQKYVKSSSNKAPIMRFTKFSQSMSIILLIGLLFLSMLSGFYFVNVTNQLILIITISSIMYIINQANKDKMNEKKIYVFLILMFSAILFWTLYFIGPIGFVFFLKNNVCHTIFGHQISPQWFMNLESFLVIIGAPILPHFFQLLRKKGITLSIVKKFSFALLMISGAFFALFAGIKHADSAGLVGLGWIIIYYILLVLGELLIAPVGYAMVGKLAPSHLQGIMMGTWLMICGVATIFSHHISNSMNFSDTNNPLVTNNNYLLVFCKLGVYATFAGVCLFFFAKKIDFFMGKDEQNLNHMSMGVNQ